MSDPRSASSRCEKSPVVARQGMVVTNHPLASAAGVEMLAAGGNAVDAAVAALFALTVVEPMMVGIFGGGLAHIRMADGRHVVLDGLSAAPARASATTFEPVSDLPPRRFDTAGRRNEIGALSVATPGSLRGWCDALALFGRLPLADVMEPAIRHARRGFAVSPYLAGCVAEAARDLAADREIAALFLPRGDPVASGQRLVMGDYAQTLAVIAREGPGAFYDGAIADAIVDYFARSGGLIGRDDLAAARTVERAPVHGHYRGFDIYGPPPPSAGGVHLLQMLAILEGFDLCAMGFGTADAIHLLREALETAVPDRAAATADPAFVEAPVERLVSRAYAEERRARIDMARTQDWTAGVVASGVESPNTTHVTVADAEGSIVASTQTINSLFGARVMIPGTGLIPNNYMSLFDPHPGRALSIAPGKRVTTSMAPTIAFKDGRPAFALGLPGGLRIFGAAMQALVNLIDHGMSVQEAVEAPRVWTQGQELEVESDLVASQGEALAARGWRVLPVPHVAGGMAAIRFGPDGDMTGAACWRADGMAIGLGGGQARAGTRFWPDAPMQARADETAR